MNTNNRIKPQSLLHLLCMVVLLLTIPCLKSYAKYSIKVLTHDLSTTTIGEGKIEVTADGHSGPYTVYWSDNTTSIISPIGGVFTATKGGLTQGTYIVTVENAHGCYVDLQAVINDFNRTYISVTAFLEGPFNGNTDLMEDKLNTLGYLPLFEPYSSMGYLFPENSSGGQTTTQSVISQYSVVDWIVVELHDDFGMTWARSGLLLRDGRIVDTDGVSDLEAPETIFNGNNHYVKLHHRNHLDVKMNDPIQVANERITVDFSNPTLHTTGQQSLSENRVGMHAGDASYDNCVDAEDRAVTWNQRNLFGYLNADVNLDGVVSAQDRAIASNNEVGCYNPNESSYDSTINCVESSQNIWIGPLAGEAWNSSTSNWSQGRIPTYCDDVLIPSGNKVSINPSHPAACSTLIVELGAELDIPIGAIINVENL